MVPVAAVLEAGVEEYDISGILMLANEASDALTKFNEGLGKGVLRKGVFALLAEPFGFGLDDGLGRIFKGDPGNDDLGQGGAGDIDTRPKTVGPKKDAGSGFPKGPGQGGPSQASGLLEEGAIIGTEGILEKMGDFPKIAVTGKEDEAAAFDPRDEELDIVGQFADAQAGFVAGRRGDIQGEVGGGVLAVGKGRGDLPPVGIVGPRQIGEGADIPDRSQGGTGHEDRGFALKQGFAQVGGDIDGGIADGDDGLFFSSFFDPMDMILLGEGERLVEAGDKAFQTFFLIVYLIPGGALVSFLQLVGKDLLNGPQRGRQKRIVPLRRGDATEACFLEVAISNALKEEVPFLQGLLNVDSFGFSGGFGE